MTDDNENGARETGRARVILRGVLRFSGGDHECRVADLSATGARIMTDIPLSEGEIVGLTIASHGEFPGAVIWSDGQEAGVQFIEGVEGGLRRFGDKAGLLGVKS
ncbi:MAG: PilZ domain-containing protein [Pacificimonas sp.]